MIEQGTEAWHQQRLGKATASRIADIVAKTKTGWGASRANYAAELVCERLTGTRTEGFTNAAMAFGTENEPLARAAYEFRHDVTVELASFIDHPKIEMSGASPDGFVGADGLIEIKVPNSATHIQTLLAGAIPEKYRLQMTWQMACTGRQYCDFVSFDPRLPEEMKLFVRRFDRDETLIGQLEREVEIFLGEVDDTIKRLRNQYAEAA
jgi:putative phage-type endonuclease